MELIKKRREQEYKWLEGVNSSGVNIVGMKTALLAQLPNSGVNVIGLKVASPAQLPTSGGGGNPLY